MDLESPLRTLASPVEAEVLRVLAGVETGFSAPQIHRLIDSASPYGVRKALSRLADTGLVSSAVYGSSTLWQANRQHVLWPAIQSAVGARRELLDRIRRRIEECNGVSAYLYGSFARRAATANSDVDILLVHPDDTSEEAIVDAARDLADQIQLWTGNVGHIFSTTEGGLATSAGRNDPVMQSIREDAVTIVGKEFAQLLREIDGMRSARA